MRTIGLRTRITVAMSAFAVVISLTGPGTAARAAASLDPSRLNWRVKVDLDAFQHDPGVGPDGTIYIPNKFGRTQAVDPVNGATK